MRDHPLFSAYVALGAVCFFWGTTYLGIRAALESFPPLVLMASRFVISGGILLGAVWLRGMQLPRGRELARTAANGVLTLGIGNCCVTFSELWIPSGLTALFVTTSPFWMVGIEALLVRQRLHAPTVLGMLAGFSGTALLVAPDAIARGWGGNTLRGFAILQLGAMSWALGSVLQKGQPQRAHPVVAGAVQQLAAGLTFVLPALLVPSHPIRWTPEGVGALVYLATFGSIVGYSAYIYALSKLPVAIVSLHTYVNPVVAVALGWLFYRERFGVREAVAMLVIFAGVAIVKRVTPGGNAEIADRRGEAA